MLNTECSDNKNLSNCREIFKAFSAVIVSEKVVIPFASVIFAFAKTSKSTPTGTANLYVYSVCLSVLD
ncbi:MAG: hypothetical protein ABI550_06560 [Ignavibacteriaceae bacterium]